MKYTTHTSAIRSTLRSKPGLVNIITSLTVNKGTKCITRDGFEAYLAKYAILQKVERPKWMHIADWYIANMPENDEVYVDQKDELTCAPLK